MSNNFADLLDQTNTYRSWQKPMSFIHTVSAAESGSGIVKIGIVSIPEMQQTDGLIKTVQVFSSAEVEKTAGFMCWYSDTSGVLQIQNAGVAALATDDVVNVVASFYTV
jgi:hypothetical protein